MLSLSLLPVASLQAQTRIATVDLQKIYDGYNRQKQAFAALKENAAELEKEDKAMRDDFRKATEAYQKLRDEAGDPALSTEERAKREKIAGEKYKELKDNEKTIVQYEMQAQEKIAQQRHRIRDKMLDEIRAVINARAKAGGYSLVIDVSAKSGNSTLEMISMAMNRQDPADEYGKTTPVILYSNPDTDISAAVLEQLNTGTTDTTTPKPPEKKDEKKDGKK